MMSTSAKRRAWPPTPGDTCSSTREQGSPQLTLGTERHFHRGNGAARLFEFDPSGKYLREIGQGLYGFVFAHTVRVDPQDNIWTVDEGSGTIVKFNPQGQVQMVLGRTPEYLPMPNFDRVNSMGTVAKPTGPVGVGVEGDEFDRPTDVGVGQAGQHLHRRRPRQLAHREVRLERQVRQVVGVAGNRRRASSTSRTRS